MKPITINFQPCAHLTSNSNPYNRCVTSIAEKIKAYAPLLNKITRSFGFNDSESRDLIYQVSAYTLSNYWSQENNHSLRIWLVKMVVHKCIFIISSRFFSQVDSNMGKNNEEVSSHSCAYISTYTFTPQDMPVSFWVVLVLKNTIGFSEPEIATILNTTTRKVKERLNKALAYRNGYPSILKPIAPI